MPKYRVFLLAPETGTILNPDGTLYRRDQVEEPVAPYFESRDAALEMKDAFLRRVPWAIVDVFDFTSGRDEYFHDEIGSARYALACKALSRWRRLPFFLRVFFKRPPDPRA